MTRKTIFTRIAAIGTAAVMVFALALTVLPKVFATQEYLKISASTLTVSDSTQTATVKILAGMDEAVWTLQGAFATTETNDTNKYFTLDSLDYDEALASSVTNNNNDGDGAFLYQNNSIGIDFEADKEIWVANYTVAANTPAGVYDLPIEIEVGSFGPETYLEGETLVAQVTITDKEAQEMGFSEDEVAKVYGDGVFTNELVRTSGDGAISYSSSNDEIAEVDENGEVTIHKPGRTMITATAAETATYAETAASYVLNVDKKSVSIETLTIENKEYDGTTEAEVDEVELDVEVADREGNFSGDVLLSYNDEDCGYKVNANFEDANAGENKNVSAELELLGDASDYFEVSGDPAVASATIAPFDIEGVEITALQEQFVYTGATINPTVRIKAELGTDRYVYLTENDYDVTYPDDMISAGDKTLEFAGKGNYTGTEDFDYTVDLYTIESGNVSLEYPTVVFDNTAKTPGVTVKIGDFEVSSDEYDVEYSNNIGIGTATVTVTAKDDMNIDGSATKTFEITDKRILEISGISSQAVAYTGQPVVLSGSLSVGANTDEITVDDIITAWFESDGKTPTERPTEVGSYVVTYYYNGDNYIGNLTVAFEITKATSPMPAEMTAGLKGEVGYDLWSIEYDWSDGFDWADDAGLILLGDNTYPATYTYEDDTEHYTTLELSVPVKGTVYIDIYTYVDDDETGSVVAPEEAEYGDSITFEFLPKTGYEIKRVLLNRINVTNSVVNNKLTITAGTTDIELEVEYRRVYNVIEGDNNGFVVNNDEVTFRMDADYELFENGGKVYLDGVLVDPSNYVSKPGSTIITFTNTFLNSLNDGNHELIVAFNNGGIARANFALSGTRHSANPVKTPDTGFFSGEFAGARVAGITAVSFLAIAGVMMVFYRKRFAGKKVDFDKE
ncbi:Ig-like domain-containing protein [Candidatus Saccharibacteria bacterium]|nr:Ig-like domain-containing protein [Candidatus Saccharibacteria bacterium]